MRFRRSRRVPASYEEQTYASPHAIVRIPHRKRYEVGRDAILGARPLRLLDYGAGDGKVLAEALEGGLSAERIVAYEPVDEYARLLAGTVAPVRGGDRVAIVTEREDLVGERFDFICCLGVLEHMPLPERKAFYEVCERTLDRDGAILIDVPVEVGPSLFIKSMARMVLKGRAREYGWRELLRICLGGSVRDPARYDQSSTSTWIHDHKGFDYRLFQRELERRFAITGRVATPFRWLPAPLGNQEVFFTARRHGR